MLNDNLEYYVRSWETLTIIHNIIYVNDIGNISGLYLHNSISIIIGTAL